MEKKEEKNEWSNEKLLITYGIIGIFLLTFLIIVSINSTMIQIAEKNYMASITPEERQEIAEKELQLKLEEERRNEESNKAFEKMTEGLILFLYAPIPNIFFLVCLLFVWTYRGRSRW